MIFGVFAGNEMDPDAYLFKYNINTGASVVYNLDIGNPGAVKIDQIACDTDSVFSAGMFGNAVIVKTDYSGVKDNSFSGDGIFESANLVSGSTSENIHDLYLDESGNYLYVCNLNCEYSGRFGFTVRVMPAGDSWIKTTPRLLTWA